MRTTREEKRPDLVAATSDLIVIGASAGGIEAMQTLVADLPVNFPAALFLVIHVAA